MIRRQRGFHVGGAVFLAFCPENFCPPLFLWRGNSSLLIREVRYGVTFLGVGVQFCVWGFITIDVSSGLSISNLSRFLQDPFGCFFSWDDPCLQPCGLLPWRAPWFFPFFIQPFFCFVPPTRTVFQLWKTSALVHLRA